jgi:trehalose 6-phosphate phosphatase
VLEVRPPVRIDKGAGITAFLDGEDVDVAMYVGDDTTDLDAFRSLDQLVQDGRLSQSIKVGVRSDEGPEEILSDADLIVEGTKGVLSLLSLLVSDG